MVSDRPRIVVVGGGVVGLFSAITLAERGCAVVLVERGLPGAANSTLTGGGIRQQFGSEISIAMSQQSQPWWDGFSERFGVDPLFRPIGYLFLARSQGETSALKAQVAFQNSHDVDSEFIGADEIEQRWPALAGRGFTGAGFRQRDGWANQHRIVDGLVRGCLDRNVELHVGTECLAITTRAGQVRGIETNEGPIGGDAVLFATGPWGLDFLAEFHPRLPVQGHRHELLIVQPARPLPPGLPWLIGVDDQVHLRGDSPGRALVGGFLGRDDEVDADTFLTRVQPQWANQVRVTAARVFGVVDADARIQHGWAGLYPSTPDRHPIIDRLAPGLYAAMGFSGTGLMHAPAAGLLAAELIIEGAITSLCAEKISAGRFTSPIVRPERTGF